jgi:hypothetical protein
MTRPLIGLADLYPPKQPTEQRVGVLGSPGHIPASHTMTTRSLFEACGQNTGNLAFFHALGTHIAANISYFGWNFEPDHVNERVDCLVIAAANQLNPAWDLADVASRLERVRVPVCVVGLGAQWHGDIADLHLSKGTVRFAKILAEKAHVIGVRGEQSGIALEKIGVRNWNVIGCPSLFINLNQPRLGRLIEANFISRGAAPNKVIINFDVGSNMAGALERTEAMVRNTHVSLVCQAPLTAVAMARGDDVPQDANYAVVMDTFARTSAAFKSTAIRSAVSFFSVDAWLEWCHAYDFSIGTRLHGNIIAMQAGIPSMVIAHDGRTEELAATMKLPSMHIAQFSGFSESLREAYRACAFNPEAFDGNRMTLLRRYIEILELAGVCVSTRLRALFQGFDTMPVSFK